MPCRRKYHVFFPHNFLNPILRDPHSSNPPLIPKPRKKHPTNQILGYHPFPEAFFLFLLQEKKRYCLRRCYGLRFNQTCEPIRCILIWKNLIGSHTPLAMQILKMHGHLGFVCGPLFHLHKLPVAISAYERRRGEAWWLIIFMEPSSHITYSRASFWLINCFIMNEKLGKRKKMKRKHAQAWMDPCASVRYRGTMVSKWLELASWKERLGLSSSRSLIWYDSFCPDPNCYIIFHPSTRTFFRKKSDLGT